jgi:hypothetical protein
MSRVRREAAVRRSGGPYEQVHSLAYSEEAVPPRTEPVPRSRPESRPLTVRHLRGMISESAYA